MKTTQDLKHLNVFLNSKFFEMLLFNHNNKNQA